jgi:hypothetical protein
MFNLNSLLTPDGSTLLEEPMCVAEIFPKRDCVFLLPYFTAGEKATQNPDRKPKKFKLSELCKEIKAGRIVLGKIKLEAFKEVPEELNYDRKGKLLPSIAERDRRFEIVEALLGYKDELFYPERGKSPIRIVAEQYDTTKTCVQRYLNTFFRGGRAKNSLITSRGRHCTSPTSGTKKRGRPRKTARVGIIGKNVDDNDIKVMKKIAKRDFVGNGLSLKKSFSNLIKEHFYLQKGSTAPDGSETEPTLLALTDRVSINQFRDWMPKLLDCPSMKEVHAMRGQKVVYEANNAARAGHSEFEADGPGDVWMMDSTEIDIELVSPTNRQAKISRATLYVIRDAFSRSICGIYLAYGKASWKEARLALFHAIRKKVEFAKEYGLDLTDDEWAEYGMPRVLLVDNEEFQNKISASVGKDLGLEVCYSRAYRGDDKGLSESSFNMIHAMAKNEKIPGFRYKNLIGRNRNLPMKTACLTLFEMQQILIIYAIYHNNHIWKDDFPIEESALKAGLNRVCREYWDWGLRNRNYYLQEKSDRQLYLSLLEVGTLTVHKTHFHLQEIGTNYYCEEIRLKKFQDRPKMPNSQTHKTLPCRYIRSGLNKIMIEFKGEFYVARLTRKHQQECGKLSVSEFYEWQDELKIKKDIFEGEHIQNEHEFSDKVQSVVGKAKKAKESENVQPQSTLPSKPEASKPLIEEADQTENKRYENALDHEHGISTASQENTEDLSSIEAPYGDDSEDDIDDELLSLAEEL